MDTPNKEKKLPKVFIIILNYNGREYIKKCLTSVFKIDYPNLEVVVVDNNSDDGSLELAKTLFQRATFIKNQENIGFSAGNNVGIRYALERMADYVILLNQDTEVKTDFLEKIIKTGQNDPELGVVSPLIIHGDTERVWFSGGKIDWKKMKSINETENILAPNYNCDFISGCAMAVKKEVFQKIGLLDEDFFLYWEDTDFCFRAHKAGFKMAVTPETSVRHYEKSAESNGQKIYWLVISGLLFFQKNASFRQKLWVTPYYFLRRVKNKKDLKKEKKDAYFVAKAYRDFASLWQEKK